MYQNASGARVTLCMRPDMESRGKTVLRYAREAGAARRLLAGTPDLEILAARALATAPLPRLAVPRLVLALGVLAGLALLLRDRVPVELAVDVAAAGAVDRAEAAGEPARRQLAGGTVGRDVGEPYRQDGVGGRRLDLRDDAGAGLDDRHRRADDLQRAVRRLRLDGLTAPRKGVDGGAARPLGATDVPVRRRDGPPRRPAPGCRPGGGG